MKKSIILLGLVLTFVDKSQPPPKSFIEGLAIFKTDPAGGKAYFFEAIREDSLYYGSYNFIGIGFANEKSYDSAIYYLKTSLRLNLQNVNHTKEFTLARLCRLYIRKGDFENAFTTAIASISEFPSNTNFLVELKDACLWSYYLHYTDFDKSYLDPDPLPAYTVGAVSQEYLIMRNIRIDGDILSFKGQTYNSQQNMDILECLYGKENKQVNLNFNLAWDVMKSFGDKMPDYKKVYENKILPVYERVGAALSGDGKTDMMKEIKKIQNS